MEIGAGGSSMNAVKSYRTNYMELRWATRRSRAKKRQSEVSLPLQPPTFVPLPLYISTNSTHIKPHELRALYSACNLSCHRFPNYVDSHGRVEAVDIHKLRIALSHSSILVSVFCNPQHINPTSTGTGFPSPSSETSLTEVTRVITSLGSLCQRVMVPVSPVDGQLVGFGRAISDHGLTASIYDVMVIPPLQGMGIGQMIVERIVRMLTNKGIYDIAALCSKKESLFFKACGFGNDILDSTTMMYAKKVSTHPEGRGMVVRAGRRLLLAPPLRVPFASSKDHTS